MALQHPADRGGGKRGPFERFAEAASLFTSSPVFHLLCLAMVVAVVVTHASGVALEWKVFAGECMTAVTLLLLALLKNSEQRADRAIQRKLDAIATALVESHVGDREQAFEDLKAAIRMEEET
ncbi:low affinity iron permease family protein [Streptomyces sp. NPDC047706]|uniref:low affinity iron permease family protein n=1 Tax=Streptomyces sp. NPDC047706 TaxID=3365486 RepID=UPI003715F41B